MKIGNTGDQNTLKVVGGQKILWHRGRTGMSIIYFHNPVISPSLFLVISQTGYAPSRDVEIRRHCRHSNLESNLESK